MKKLALLLGALSLVSSVAYAKEVVPAVEEVVVVEEAAPVAAAPALRVTHVGQGLEIDNTSGQLNIGEGVHFSNTVGLAYDDWTFGLMARKTWSMDTDEGIHSEGFRIDLDAWKNYENFSVGARWRQESNKDRYLARFKYSYGMFSGWVDAGYDAVNDTDADDGYYVEAEPVKVTVGPVTLGYWFKTENDIMKGDESAIEHWYRHQLRASMPIYQGEKLNVGVQYGWEFANNLELADSSKTYAYKHDNGTHALWLNASYKVNENLTIDGYYEYDMYKWEVEGNKDGDQVDGLDSKDSSKYYGEFYIGWTYTF